jgi:D-arabinonate dehydratase
MSKITNVRAEAYRWPRNVPITNGLYTYSHSSLFVIYIDTDDGVTGLGLGTGIMDAPKVGLEIADYLGRKLIGQDPLDIERHWYTMWRPKLVGRRGITTRVISGIDIALWDLKGKLARMPLYKLLGGFSDSVGFYIAGGYYEDGKGLDDMAAEMQQHVRLGARAVKMKVGAASISKDVERVKVVREAVGPDIQIMVDANNAYRHYQALKFAREVEKYDVFWFEEPVEPDDYEGQREITRATAIPIAAGENEYTKFGFRDMINRRCADILQPDALVMGGITEFMKVAALAQANELDIAPHGNQYVHIHLVCAIPNGLILEYYKENVDPILGKAFIHQLEVKNGRILAPDRLGLGLELNYDVLRQYKVI